MTTWSYYITRHFNEKSRKQTKSRNPSPGKDMMLDTIRAVMFGFLLNYVSRLIMGDKFMWSFLDKIPYAILIIIAVLMLLAPFKPMPHVVEKLIMLKNGVLTKPIDIFDLFYHLIPTILLAIKIVRDVRN
jgi:hypothetical protein